MRARLHGVPYFRGFDDRLGPRGPKPTPAMHAEAIAGCCPDGRFAAWAVAQFRQAQRALAVDGVGDVVGHFNTFLA